MEKGEKEFINLLRKLWTETEERFFSFDLALFFVSALPIKEVKQHIVTKIDHVEKNYQYLKTHKEEHMGHKYVPPIAFSIMDHSLAHLRAELGWLKSLQKKIEGGEIL